MIRWDIVFVFLFVASLCIKYNDRLCQTASRFWSPQIHSVNPGLLVLETRQLEASDSYGQVFI
jgi:hypothetical protein